MEFISYIKNLNNIFEILIDEYLQLISDENVRELIKEEKPIFQITLPTTISNYYNECSVFYNNQLLTFILYYKKQEDTFNVFLKLNYDNSANMWISNIFTFLLSVGLVFDNEKPNKKLNKVVLKQFNDSKSQVLIYRQSCFSRVVKSEIEKIASNSNNNYNINNNFSLRIFLKPCLVHSAITYFIINNFSNFYNDMKLVKLSTETLQFILRSYSNKNNNDILVIALMNWCNYYFLIRKL